MTLLANNVGDEISKWLRRLLPGSVFGWRSFPFVAFQPGNLCLFDGSFANLCERTVQMERRRLGGAASVSSEWPLMSVGSGKMSCLIFRIPVWDQ